MLNDSLIVTTALSAFNNAALYGPLFFITGLLSVPLFFMVYLYAGDFADRFRLNKDIEKNTVFFSSLILMLWVMLFGGNYAVIRDSISLLPVLIAIMLFGLNVVVAQKLIQLKYMEKIKDKKSKWLIFFGLILIAVASSSHSFWNILLQVSAVLCGLIVGCRIKTNLKLNPWIVILFFFMTVLVLMQPEFFRFGQLGNLTIIHLFGIMLTGFFAITALTTKYINPRTGIYQSAYIKLKWLFRIVSLLAFALFIMTESVPVFLGLILAIGLLQALSIYHSDKRIENISNQSCGLLIFMLGIIVICPVISALGIMYLVVSNANVKFKEYLKLL